MPTKNKRINAVPSRDTFIWAMQAAFREKRSLSALCVVALEDYLERNHPDLDPDKQGFISNYKEEIIDREFV